eukprot:gene346-biopygen63
MNCASARLFGRSRACPKRARCRSPHLPASGSFSVSVSLAASGYASSSGPAGSDVPPVRSVERSSAAGEGLRSGGRERRAGDAVRPRTTGTFSQVAPAAFQRLPADMSAAECIVWLLPDPRGIVTPVTKEVGNCGDLWRQVSRCLAGSRAATRHTLPCSCHLGETAGRVPRDGFFQRNGRIPDASSAATPRLLRAPLLTHAVQHTREKRLRTRPGRVRDATAGFWCSSSSVEA